MRKVLFFLAGLLIACMLTAYIFGGKIQEHYLGVLDEINASGVLRVSNMDYQRGFFHSTAQTWVTPVSSAQAQSHGEGFALDHDFIHGPFPVESMTNVFTTRPLMAIVRTKTSASQAAGLEGLTSTWRIPFQGIVLGDVLIPTGQLVWDDGEARFSDVQGNLVYDQEKDTLQLQFLVDKLVHRDRISQFSLQDMRCEIQFAELTSLQSLGRAVLDIASLASETMGQEVLRLENIHLDFEIGGNDTMAHFSQSLDIDRVMAHQQELGPLHYDFALRNIQRQVLGHFFQLASATLQDGDMLWSPEMAHLLLSYKPQLLSNLRLKSPEGELTGTFRAFMHPPAKAMCISPFLLLGYLDVLAEIRVHEGLAWDLYSLWAGEEVLKQQFQEKLRELISRGYIARDGEVLETNITFERLRLQVMNQNIPYLPFFQ